MADTKTERLRDPVHGLIVFRDKRDSMAWALLNTQEFQRLRRIKQLGVSEFVFPGATHTRFAHSIGVFQTARKLVYVLKREIGDDLNRRRADVAVIAAMIHDVGHGPFSHVFEEVQRERGAWKKHEAWSADIITNPKGNIWPILVSFGTEFHGDGEGFANEVADLLVADVPRDIYHAIVSSSFDADRLDYLRRDRLMTGSGAGAIDFDWLMDNLRVATIDLSVAENDGNTIEIPGFCFHRKALQAAETFLLARYHLYTQVYLHKATRGIERMLAALIRRTVTLIAQGTVEQTGLALDHPLVRYLLPDGGTLENYLGLDDLVVWGAIERMTHAGDRFLETMATRLLKRELYKSLDVEEVAGADLQEQRMFMRKLEVKFRSEFNELVLKDESSLSIYGEVGIDEDKIHQRLMILDGAGKPHEITGTGMSKLVEPLAKPKAFIRYYFADGSQRDEAKGLVGGQK